MHLKSRAFKLCSPDRGWAESQWPTLNGQPQYERPCNVTSLSFYCHIALLVCGHVSPLSHGTVFVLAFCFACVCVTVVSHACLRVLSRVCPRVITHLCPPGVMCLCILSRKCLSLPLAHVCTCNVICICLHCTSDTCING